jgi:hypothetical protein
MLRACHSRKQRHYHKLVSNRRQEQLLKGYDGTCGKSKTLVKGYAMYSDELLLDRRFPTM